MNQNETGNSSTEKADATLNGRRRFLKGTALALPAVTTLTPGAAQALTSITCGQRALDGGLNADFLLLPPGNTDDGHFRLPVTVYDKLVEVPDGHGNMVLTPNHEPTYFEGLSQGQPVWRSCFDGAVVGTERPDDCNPQPNLMYPTAYAIVHVDAQNGEVVSCGAPDNPPNAIITSAAGACMASLAMHQP